MNPWDTARGAYATPLSYHQVDNSLRITTDSGWYKNFQSAEDQATVQLRGRSRRVRVEVVTDPDDSAAGLAAIVKVQPGYGRWANVNVDARGEPNRDQVRAEIARGRVLLRLQLLSAEAR